MANRIVLNTISYHGKGALENIVPELTGRGFHTVSYTHLDVYKRQASRSGPLAASALTACSSTARMSI